MSPEMMSGYATVVGTRLTKNAENRTMTMTNELCTRRHDKTLDIDGAVCTYGQCLCWKFRPSVQETKGPHLFIVKPAWLYHDFSGLQDLDTLICSKKRMGGVCVFDTGSEMGVRGNNI